jgi:hypothetical protein
MTTWEIGQKLECIMERGERAAAIDLLNGWIEINWREEWTEDLRKEKKNNDLHS